MRWNLALANGVHENVNLRTSSKGPVQGHTPSVHRLHAMGEAFLVSLLVWSGLTTAGSLPHC
jgi:hypothetical protein